MSDTTNFFCSRVRAVSLVVSLLSALFAARVVQPARRTVAVLTAAAVAAALLAAIPTTAAAHEGFSDVPDSGPHSANIHTLDHAGTFVGTECGPQEFCPWDPLTRAHMAVWLVRVIDGSDPAPVTGTRFVDVDGTHPQAAFIERFAALGITEGCDSEPLRYCPDDNVSRAQMASFLVRAFNLAPADSAGFVDVASGGAHSANIDTLAASGITEGCATGPLRYCPDDDVQRAQMASFLARAETTTTAPPDDEWVEPYVGYVPDVHPDTPPPGWERGDPTGRGADDVPRSTGEDREVVAGWIAWMGGGGGYSGSLLHSMKWALDYLGAHPGCVINQYYNRVDALRALNLAPGRAEPYHLTNDHGWHNCATVIDPFLAGVELPAGRSDDVGLRLSDTPGITLAEKCRAVLPDDIKLESYRGGVGYIDHFGHAGCDAWAEWITTRYDYGRYTQCRESVFLAEEWMEHYRGQPNGYIRGSC